MHLHNLKKISEFDFYKPDSTSGKTSSSGAGEWVLNPELIKPPTRCQRLATVATLIYGPAALLRSWIRHFRQLSLLGDFKQVAD